MSRESKQLSWRKKSLRAAFGRKLHIEPLEQRQLLDAAPLPLPTPNIPAMPKLQPTVITAGGQRLLLNYFNNASNAAHNPAAEVQVTFDSNSDTLVCNKPGWYVENFPLAQIAGLQGMTGDQVAALLFGAGETQADVQNWYIMTPVDATHPAPAEPAAPTGPAPITPTNLTAPVNGSYFHVLVVDSGYSGSSTSDPSYYNNTLLSGGNTLGAYLTDVTQANNQVKVDSNVYSTITAAVNALTSSAYYSSTSQSVTQPTIILITPGSGSYEEIVKLDTTYSLNGGSGTDPLILEGVADANGNMPVWTDATSIANGWTQVGTSGVYKSTLNANLFLGQFVVEHTNSMVNGDLTPGSGNQQTLIQRSLPSDLQQGEMTYQLASDQFENNLNGMSSRSAYAQMPSAGLPSNATWTTVNAVTVNSDPGYLDFGSTGAGAAANSVYWASSWVWVPPGSSNWNWQNPETLTESVGNFTYGPFRISLLANENSSNQYNKDRIWVNGQMIPAAIFSTGANNESLDPHSYSWWGDNIDYGGGAATDEIECLNLQQGWNHLVFQFDTSSTASASNMFQSEELAFKFGLNSQFFPNSSGLISQATAPANLSQAPAIGTPEPYISQYSVLTTSTTPGVIVAPFTGDMYDPAIYVRLRNDESPASASMAMLQSNAAPLATGAFTQVRGLDFLGSGVNLQRQGDLLEGCITNGFYAGWGDPSYAVGPNVASGYGSIGYGNDNDALNFSAMGWTNNVMLKPDCQIANGTPVNFYGLHSSSLPPSVSGSEYADNGNYYSQVYYLGLTGTDGVYDVYSDSGCTQKVLISSGWTSQYNNVSIRIGLSTTSMAPITMLNNWILNDSDIGSCTSGEQPDLITSDSENGNGNGVALGRLQTIVEYNMFLNSDTAGAPVWWADGGTKSFFNDGSVFCYNVYDGGSNQALWFDTENWNNRVEGNIFENFPGCMVNFEASPGPNLVANNIIFGMLGTYTPNGESGIGNNSSNQTWAVNNTIDSQSQPLNLIGTYLAGCEIVNRGNHWEWASGYDMYGGYYNDPNDACVNNVVLGCNTTTTADMAVYHTGQNGYVFDPDTVAGNYTDNPTDSYLTNASGVQTQYPNGLQFLSQADMGFVNEAAGNYQLTPDSPLNTAGVTTALYSNGPQADYQQGNYSTTTYGYNVMSLITHDAYGLLRDIPGDPESAGAARPGINFSSTDIEWENAAGTQARLTDYFPNGPSSPPIVTVKATTPTASDSGPSDGVFTLTRDGSTIAPLTIYYTLGGTAVYGSSGQIYDYTLSSGQTSVTIPAGYATATITLYPQDDGVPTGAETAVLTLGSSPFNYSLAGQMADTVTIAAHDPATVSILGSGTITEGGSPGTFTVSRTGSTARALVVYYNTINGTATNGVDYQTLSGQVTIPASQTTATITLTPTEDLLVDATEGATLTIATDPNNIYAPSAINYQATISIADTANEDGLVSEWKLDELGGANVSDSSGNGLGGTFQTSPVLYSTGVNTRPQAVASGDFNGDGKLDLVTANASASNVSILLNNGNGTFPSTPSYTCTVGPSPAAIAVGDFNGDGKLDLAVVDTGSSRVSILLGNGNGTFRTQQTYNVGANPVSIAVGNFNPGTDGYLDLAVANIAGNTVSILLGNGDGTFKSQTTYTVGKTPRSIVAGDFNGDGKLDLATANNGTGANTVSVLAGNGDGTFQSAVPYAVGTSPYAVIAGDFNGDGLLDLATANSGSNNVSVLLNAGNGTFPTQTTYPTGSDPTSIVAGDFNGDGKLDLAAANYGTGVNTVSVLAGNGDGTFQTQTTYAVGSSPISVTATDIFGLGKLDLVTANYAANNVSAIVVQPWSSGRLNGALTLENINSQYVSVPSNSNFNFGNGSFTLSTWMKPAGFTAVGDNYTILARGQNTANYFEFGLSYGVNNGVFLTVGSGGTTMTLTPTTDQSSLLGDGNWHLVTVTRDGASGIGTMYIDGQSVGTLTGMSVINVSPIDSRNLGIGACLDQGANYKYFNGKLDDVRVYNTCLSSTEVGIMAGIQNGVSIVATDPVAGVNDNTPDNAVCYPNGVLGTSLHGFNALDTAGQGQFTLVRTGDASLPLTVYYTIGGSAAAVTDYQALSGQATFLAGHTTTTITVQPLLSSLGASDKTIIVTLIPDSQYELAAQAAADTATVTITGKRLSADWTLNQNANDSSGNGLNGTLPNGGTWATGGGLTLDGNNQYLSAPQVSLGTSAFTLSTWVELSASVTSLSSNNNIYPIITNGLSGLGYNGFDLCVIGGGYNGLWLRIGGDMKGNLPSFQMTPSVDVRGALLNHQWHMVTATRDNFGVVRLYFDGALVGTALGVVYSVTNANQSSNVTIGYNYYNQNNYFDGTIADVQVYNRALEPGEIENMATLAAPSGLTATVVSTSQINLTWTAPANIEVNGYNVYRSTTSGVENASPPINGATLVTGTAYNDTTVASGTTYYYTVEAVNGVGGSIASNEASALTVPAAPTGLGATPISATQINLSWTAPSGTVTGYYVYRGTSTGGESGTALNTTALTTTSYSDTTAVAGTTYYYKVEAANATGNGANSNEASALTVPAAPTGLGATPISATQINLAWTSPGGTVTGYYVYRGTSTGGESGTALNTTALTTTSYSDTTAVAGTTYYYKVEAANATGNGANSNEASALTVPAAPTGLGATPISATQINLIWTAPSGTVTSYYVYRGTSTGGESVTALNTTALTTTSYSDATAVAGTTYYYKVEAANGTGNGANSNEASALTVPAAPTGLGATPISATQINLTWTAPSGTVTGYYVYRGASTGGESATALNTTAITTTSYSDATAVAGTTYYYKVEAANATGNGANSNEASALTVPAAPTGLGATPISATQINLAWTSPGGTVTGYYVYRGTSTGGESATALNTTAITTTSYSDTTAVAGTTYYYKVEAANGTGNGANSNEASALTVPAAPTGLGATPISATQINLTWTAPSGTVTGYYVYRGTSTGGESATALNTTAITTTSYSDATAVAGTTYYYKVEAANGTGNGANSNEASAVTAPAAPTGLGATPISATQINLTWTAPSGTVTGYYVYRGTAGDGESATALNTTAITTTSYSDATATAGTTYYYKVEAANGTGNGANSNEASALTVPAAPTGLGATPISATQINLTWTAPSGTVTGYYVYRGASTGGESATALNTTALTTTSYSDATAVAGTTYYYKVEAANGTGNGANSNEASALTVPAAPTGLGATPISATQINLTWTAPSGTVTGYYVYRGASTGGESATALNTTALTTTSYSDATAVAGTTYYYKVEAANGTGNGANSNEASALTVPAAPTGLGATPISATQINLTWTAPSGTVTGYYVYRGASTGGESATALNTTAITTTSYSDATAVAGTTYYYKVEAANATGNGANSNEASAVTAPTGLTATASASSSEINLSWTAAGGPVTSYNVYRGATQIYSGTATAFSDTGRPASTPYSYTVTVTNGSLTSAASAPASATTTAALSLPTNLVAYWRMDEGTGTSGATVYDTNPNTSDTTSDNGALSGSPTWITGKIGDALQFSGSSQYVNVTNHTDLQITSAISVACWAKSGATNWNTSDSFLSKSNSYSLGGVSSANTVEFRVYISGWKTVSYTPTFDITAWHHYVGTYDGAKLRLYVDGSLVGGPQDQTGTIGSNTNAVYLGRISSSYLNGSLDEVRVYNAALGATDVTALYSQAAPTVMGPSGLTISGSSSSGYYSVQPFALAGGVEQYGDALYSYSSVSKYLGSTFIRTANADAANGSFQMSFTINAPSIIYVLHDHSITSKPSWLTSAFTLVTTDSVTNNNSTTFDVYKATFAAGTVSLGANGGSSGKAMYSVMFQPLSSTGDPPSSQVAYWRMDEGTGTSGATVYDTNPNTSDTTSDNGALSGSPTWITGKIGDALQFSGSSQYVNVTNHTDLQITSAISVACWAKSGATNWNTSDSFLSKSNSYSLGGVSSANTVEFRVYISGWKTVSYTPTFDITAWHHYVGTYDGAKLRLYVDGSLVGGPQDQTGTIGSNTNAVYLGRISSSYLNGSLDEVRVYNAALGATDVTALYSQADLSLAGPTVNSTNSSYYGVRSNALAVGVNQYGDPSSPTITSMTNSKYTGSTLIRTSNADKLTNDTLLGGQLLSFSVNAPCMMYVLYDSALYGNATHQATWVNDFTDTGDTVTNSAGRTFKILSKVVSAGTIWLGGNTKDGSDGGVGADMYTVIFQPMCWNGTTIV